MQKKFIAKTKNNIEVYVDMEHSHAATHFKDTPGLLEAVTEAIPQVEVSDQYHQFEIDLGRELGYTDLVDVDDRDEIIYAKRPNRDIYTKFVKNRDRQKVSSIVFSLEKTSDSEYNLYTTYFGHIAPPFPLDEHERPESREFWNKHALAWGSQKIIPGTETTRCPW